MTIFECDMCGAQSPGLGFLTDYTLPIEEEDDNPFIASEKKFQLCIECGKKLSAFIQENRQKWLEERLK